MLNMVQIVCYLHIVYSCYGFTHFDVRQKEKNEYGRRALCVDSSAVCRDIGREK